MSPKLRDYQCVVVLISAMLAGDCATLVAADCWIHGTVEDLRGAVMSSVGNVTLRSRDGAVRLEVDVDGKFNARIPCGKYTLTLDGENILPYRRASLWLSAASSEPARHQFVVLRPVYRAPSEPEVRYTTLYPGGPANEEAEVRFSCSHRQGGTIVFSGDGPILMLTFNFLTVYAREISCEASKFTCAAHGEVHVEQGDERADGTSAEIDLLNRKLTLHHPATVNSEF